MHRFLRTFGLWAICASGVGCVPASAPSTLHAAARPTSDRASRDEQLLRQRLSAFEVGSCADVERGVTDPARALVDVIAHNPQGGVPVGAARCLVTGHIAEARAEVTRWLTTPGHKGLALVALRALDHLPDDEAVALGRAALQGPYAALARPTLARSKSPAVQSLVLEVIR